MWSILYDRINRSKCTNYHRCLSQKTKNQALNEKQNLKKGQLNERKNKASFTVTPNAHANHTTAENPASTETNAKRYKKSRRPLFFLVH